jgi:pyruvate dehydrogenase E2 component (dihydrolipoamide acetyltransferase)
MATEVKLPRLGQGMESGTIVRWLKTEGEQVAKGEPLYELDTDKVTQEVEAESDGVLLKIVVADGEVDVGTTVGIIGARGEDVSGLLAAPSGNGGAPTAPAAQEPAPTTEPEAAQAEPESAPPEVAAPEPAAAAPAGPPVRAEGERVKASPLARRIARERGVDLAQVVGTGPEGRVIAEDVEKAAVAPTPAATPAADAAPEFEVVELTSTRKTIARRLTEAWEAPVFQLTVTADATELVATRERMVELLREGETKPTVSDVLTRLVASALVRHRAVNANFVDGRLHRFSAANVGLAVAAPSGLVVPVIRDADRKSVQQIATDRGDLVTRARDGKLKLDDLEGGTFTISTLTCDHRAIDGSEGAEFLSTVKAFVEQPALAL